MHKNSSRYTRVLSNIVINCGVKPREHAMRSGQPIHHVLTSGNDVIFPQITTLNTITSDAAAKHSAQKNEKAAVLETFACYIFVVMTVLMLFGR